MRRRSCLVTAFLLSRLRRAFQLKFGQQTDDDHNPQRRNFHIETMKPLIHRAQVALVRLNPCQPRDATFVIEILSCSRQRINSR